MSRSKRDILETEAMLRRETQAPEACQSQSRADAEALRRISMTLRRWFELECNGDIIRGKKGPAGGFVYEENGTPFIAHRGGPGVGNRFYPISDREGGARKRLAAIMARYPSLTAYVQTDPRGCALYILKPGDVPDGTDISSCYSRGLAVLQ